MKQERQQKKTSVETANEQQESTAQSSAMPQGHVKPMPSFLSALPERSSWKSLSDTDFWACVRLAPVVQAWVNNIQAEALRRALDGEDLAETGMKLVSKKTFRKWQDSDLVVHAFEYAGIDLKEVFTEPALLSPSQLEKKFRRNPIWREIQTHIEKPRGAPTLAPISDSRPEWTATTEFEEE